MTNRQPPAHKQLDPAKKPGQIVNPIPVGGSLCTVDKATRKATRHALNYSATEYTLADYIRRLTKTYEGDTRVIHVDLGGVALPGGSIVLAHFLG